MLQLKQLLREQLIKITRTTTHRFNLVTVVVYWRDKGTVRIPRSVYILRYGGLKLDIYIWW